MSLRKTTTRRRISTGEIEAVAGMTRERKVPEGREAEVEGKIVIREKTEETTAGKEVQ